MDCSKKVPTNRSQALKRFKDPRKWCTCLWHPRNDDWWDSDDIEFKEDIPENKKDNVKGYDSDFDILDTEI